MSKEYGTFDESNVGANLALSFGDQTVMTTGSPDGHRNARSFFGLTLFRGEVEGIFYSPNASSPSYGESGGVPWLTLGIVQSTTANSVYCGESADSWGWNPGTGHVYNNGSVFATFATANPGDYCNSLVDPSGTWSLYVNGQPLGSVTITAGEWFHAISLGGDAGDRAWYVNPGVTPLEFPVIQVNEGWWQNTQILSPILLATEPYVTQPTDALANTKYDGVIDRLQNPPKISRGVDVWCWGTSKPPQLQSAQTQLNVYLFDPNNTYPQLLSSDVRDIRVPIQRLGKNAALADAENCFVGIIDSVLAPTDQTKELELTDISVMLQVPLRRPLFPPTADVSVAGKPKPKSLGICRNYVPSLFDTGNLYYACNDGSITAFGINRVQGVPIALSTDYGLLPDASGIQMLSAPVGKLTVESTSTGAAYDPVGIDVLSGGGDFSSLSAKPNGNPDGWTSPQSLITPEWQLTSGEMVQKNQFNSDKFNAVTMDTAYILNGHSYIVQVIVTAAPAYGAGVDPDGNYTYSPPANLIVGMAGGGLTHGFIISGSAWQQCPTAGTYTFTIRNNSGQDWPLGVAIDPSSLHVSFPSQLKISDIKMQALPDIAENVVLPPLTLDQCLQNILIKEGPLTGADYDSASAQAIDTATGYGYGIHIEPTNNPLVNAVAKQFTDCICGDLFPTRSGQLSVFRLSPPEDVADGDCKGTLTYTDFESYLSPYPDNAEGLTTRFNGCPNYSPYTDSDFGTVSLTDVPLPVRTKLKLDYQWTSVSGVQLSQRYQSAYSAPPLNTLFDLQSDGDAEAARVGGMYTVPRAFYVGTVFSPIGRQFEIGDVWIVVYPFLPGFESGRKLLVVGVNDQPSECLSELILWGLEG